MERSGRLFQDVILGLQSYWAEYGCVMLQPYNSEVGAGTFNPATFLRCLGPEPWKAAYVEPSRRPKDGRYGENPIRMQQFLQYQVLLKPAPADVLDVYFKSLESLGIELHKHDVRLVEDDWESPTLGAAGLGWEVWIDGMEITQFTYFQQAGGVELAVTSAEITYGLGRLATFLQGVDSFFELQWAPGVTFGELQRSFEVEFSRFNFDEADIPFHRQLFDKYESEAVRLFDLGMLMPGYDHVLKCSHAFNVLDARGAISVTERTGYITRVRRLARKAALLYLSQREELGYPLLPEDEKPGRADATADPHSGSRSGGTD
ncbi:MAG: glycine--tRNA ligase subunit alpha [Candidatus Eisenbacteria bacterium]|nr:glycine--tRNA ligase subunit alpha [Candidatus Eisenbacteria bacterium]